MIPKLWRGRLPWDTQGAHGEIQVKTVPISALIGLSAVWLVSFSVDASYVRGPTFNVALNKIDEINETHQTHQINQSNQMDEIDQTD